MKDKLSCEGHAPYTDHMLALKRIIRYVQGTHYGLHLYPFHIEKLVSYTDAD
jgi:hypothetical protein